MLNIVKNKWSNLAVLIGGISEDLACVLMSKHSTELRIIGPWWPPTTHNIESNSVTPNWSRVSLNVATEIHLSFDVSYRSTLKNNTFVKGHFHKSWSTCSTLYLSHWGNSDTISVNFKSRTSYNWLVLKEIKWEFRL